MERSYKTNSGVNVFAYTNPAQHGFFISMFLRAGSMYEREDECGITHFFEHIAIRNVNKLLGGELYKMLDRLGLEFNASTFGEMVQFYISGACEHFDEAASFIAELLSPIALSREEINGERMRIKAEIRENDEKSSLSSFAAAKVYEGTSLCGSILGKNRSLDKITAKRLGSYRERVLCAENIFFYVTGAATEENIEVLINEVDKHPLYPCGEPHDNVAPVPKNFGNRQPRVYIKWGGYTMIRFSFDLDMTKIRSECADLLYDILLGGYNSRLFIELSEKRGLFYDTTGGVDRYKNIGSFYFAFEVKEQMLLPAIELTLEILSEMGKSITPKEECMRAGFVDNAMLLYDDSRELNFTFAYDNHIMDRGYKSIPHRRSVYESVTPEEIRAASALLFRAENLTVSIKGNKREINEEAILELVKKYL